ncbi:hypothetical protein HKBW3S03_00202 [Candidatus Hakubella thermalkaliphila]|uniref:histidine kinase n=1 Tax=Candidatus Hakubella thermalkaliphila TaxID=2754717 RepID=A0A6V8QGB3_9ACTN|nr:ATP-binding protein [Candidatus Hakubella thermalkaliphila]GFP18697.1 hypothetical protein HKBW3S03_00202 [Candidatus Hakubella thermalkaliphila]GFP38012.1 hypothetical protein HKBW3S44_01692 [Candidatus Hakubella thermalkaliphila]GFP41821.1 hypothetical protein HKBW3C_00948 [Candidatus Hakubella thermalkaliphila]
MRELSLHLLDLVENAYEAGATRVELSLEENPEEDCLVIRVADNGCGMDEELRRTATSPFYTSRSTRRVGLGLSLLAAAAEQCGGEVQVEEGKERGTVVTATFQRSHLDRAPLGDLLSTLLVLVRGFEGLELHYFHRVGERSFSFNSSSLKKKLGGVPFSRNLRQLKEFLNEELAGLGTEGVAVTR